MLSYLWEDRSLIVCRVKNLSCKKSGAAAPQAAPVCVAFRRKFTGDSAPEINMTNTAAASETNFSDLGLPAPRDKKIQKKAHRKGTRAKS